jgi:hypothetical protein
VRTLRSAAVLLANTTSAECTAPLLAELGFSTEIVTVDKEIRERLGIDFELGSVSAAGGTGAMRALIVEINGAQPLRETLSKLASRLSSRTPHVLWLLIVIHREAGELAIACWLTRPTSPRVVALVASQRHVVDSDCETLCAMADAANESDVATHTRWLEILGRETVNRKFFRALQSSVSQLASSLSPSIPNAIATNLSLLYLSRLLFLSFLETKGWLDGDHAFLVNQFADCMVKGGRYHERVLCPLFFGTLNTRPRDRADRARSFGRIPFLNGGLFARSREERSHRKQFFSDEALGDLFGELLTRYRFTAREDTSVWSEAAIDPEMLGKAFESLMASGDRKNTGAFYTPQELVEQLTTSALSHGIASEPASHWAIVAALTGQIPSVIDREELLEGIGRIRILDPACGSGAFLVHCLERLAALRIHLGDLKPLHVVRREILTRSIFGVDINPTAVWLCELRLWLSTAIQDPERDPMKVVPLPNLDRNIRVGDSLTGGSFHTDTRIPGPARIAGIRARYTRAVGPKKISIARVLDRLERESALASLDGKVARLRHERTEILCALRSRDLFGHRHSPDSATSAQLADLRKSIRSAVVSRRNLANGGALPFSYETQFADIAAVGGFDIVIGNPPWVRVHNIDPQAKAAFAREFSSFRESAWVSGAEAASAGHGFAAQVDLAALFIEQSVKLTRPRGTIVLLVPAKLWRSLAGGGIRSHLLRNTDLIELHDLTESHQVFDAAVYPSIIVARRRSTTIDECAPQPARAVVHRRQSVLHWNVEPGRISYEDSGSPWLIVPPDVRAAFDRIRNAGRPLVESHFGRPLLGVKTGCNEAFVVRLESDRLTHDDLASIVSAERRGSIERGMLRPLHRGETVRPWTLAPAPERIIWTHHNGGPMQDLPRHTRRWLVDFRADLERRTDARGRKWWTIFRTESADAKVPRVVWADFGKNPRAAVVPANNPSVFLNSCYVARCRDITDAHALTALLNSPLAAAWLNILAEPARGGYHRYLGWTVALLPIPSDWNTARRILAPLAQRAEKGAIPSRDELLGAALRLYGLHKCEAEALVLWNGR